MVNPWVGGSRVADHPLHPHTVRKGISFVIMLMAWWIWKKRNMFIFHGAT
jgi:hypothetical protein